MQISNYLNEMEHAIRHVIGEVYVEHDAAHRLTDEVRKLTAAMEDGYRRVEWLAMNPELDDDNLGTAIYWDTYFGPDKERHYQQKDLDELNQRIAVREFSTVALAANVLQFAKQGIVLRFGKQRTGIAAARLIGDVSLDEVIWQGRNQALHWEEGQFSQKVEACFQQLAAKVDPIFSDYKTRNMAFEVIKALGWREFADVECDMLALEP
jgi:hypothetical protein